MQPQQALPLSHPRRRLGWWLVLCFLCLLPCATPLSAGQFGEYEIKAGFLYKFFSFVNWSEAPDSAQMVLVVFDTGAAGKTIGDTLAAESVHGKPLKVVQTTQVAEAKKGHILFIPATFAGDLDKVLKALQGRPVLTVGENSSFIAAGGMINFVRQGTRIRFEINPRAAQEAGLKISSQLLRLAIITEGPHSGLRGPALLAQEPRRATWAAQEL